MKWNIEGIADEIIKEMKENHADIGDLDDYARDAFFSIQSRDTKRAGLVIELVKIEVMERWEEMEDEEEKEEENKHE